MGLIRRPGGGGPWRGRASVERRLLARVDAVLACGLDVFPRLVRLLAESPLPDPELTWAAILLHGMLGGDDMADEVIRLVHASDTSEAASFDAVAEALRLVPHPGVEAALQGWVRGSDRRLRRLALRALAPRARLEITHALAALDSDDPELRSEGARALPLAVGDLDDARLASLLRAPDAGIVEAALRTALLRRRPLGHKVSLELLQAGRGAFARAAVYAALSATEAARPVFARARAGIRDPVLAEALGWLGDLDAVEVLLAWLGQGEVAAARGLQRLTGASLTDALPDPTYPTADEQPFARSWRPPPSFEVLTADPAVWNAWWTKHRGRAHPGLRIRWGRPFSVAALLWEVDEGPFGPRTGRCRGWSWWCGRGNRSRCTWTTSWPGRSGSSRDGAGLRGAARRRRAERGEPASESEPGRCVSSDWRRAVLTPGLERRTSATADLFPLLHRTGAVHLVLVVRQRYRMARGRPERIAGAKIRPVDVPWEDDSPRSSIRFPGDRFIAKPGTDVVVVGDAIAPGERAVKELEVRVRVGSLQKTVRVLGLRAFFTSLGSVGISPPQPFVRQTLRWEDAFGGMDTSDPKQAVQEPRNPCGRGLAIRPESLLGKPAPHVEDPQHPYTGPRSRPPPAGLAPLGPHFADRLRWAGTLDQRWQEERCPLPPADSDDRFNQCAVRELVSPSPLGGGEPVECVGLHPRGPLAFSLPPASFLLQGRVASRAVELPLRLDLVQLEPNLEELELSWRADLPVPGELRSVRDLCLREAR